MSHEIINNEMAYVGETPWHGLGVQLPEGATGAEMMQAAGLNWNVELRCMGLMDSEGIGYLDSPLNDYRAVVRSDNNAVFNVMSNRYVAVQNEQVVEFFREFCEAGHAHMETLGALRGGAIVWALAKLNGGSKAELPGGDKLNGYMLLATSHDGSLKTIGQPTQVRVVCNNTLSAALSTNMDRYGLRHTRAFDSAEMAKARSIMGMAAEDVARTNAIAAELAQVTLDDASWTEWMSKVFGADKVVDPKTRKLTRTAEQVKLATVNSPGAWMESAKGTLWGAVNGVTYWADHSRQSRTADARLFSAWFGQMENVKRDALRVAAEMAGVTV